MNLFARKLRVLFVLVILLQNGCSLGTAPSLYMKKLELLRTCTHKIDDAHVLFKNRFSNVFVILQCSNCQKKGDFDNMLTEIVLRAIQGAIKNNDQYDIYKAILEEIERTFLTGTIEQVKALMQTITQTSNVTCLQCKSNTWQILVQEKSYVEPTLQIKALNALKLDCLMKQPHQQVNSVFQLHALQK